MKKISVFFPHNTKKLRLDIERGCAPRERMYGLLDAEFGDDIEIVYCDSRFEGLTGLFIDKVKKYGFNPIDIKSVLQIMFSDAVIVKDNVSFTISLVCKVAKKKLIYYDCMFYIPRSPIKGFLERLSLKWCDAILSYSEKQSYEFSEWARVPIEKFINVDFCMDLGFYNKYISAESKYKKGGYVISVGRDIGRDYFTLIKACEKAKVPLKLVTLPYLLPEGIKSFKNVDVYQDLSYTELFQLYSDASVIVIPLKGKLNYPSGLRALLEAMLISKPIIISLTDYVRNEFKPKYEDVCYVDPENIDMMASCIKNKISCYKSVRYDIESCGYHVCANNVKKNILRVIG